MAISEQQFLDSLNAEQNEFFNSRIISIRQELQKSYDDAVASVVEAKQSQIRDAVSERDAEKTLRAEKQRLAEELKEENDRLKTKNATLERERNALKAELNEIESLRERVITLTDEISRLTALVPPAHENYLISSAELVERLEAASPGVIDRLWASDTKEAGRLAVTLFTWSERIDCRQGGRLEDYLNMIVQMGLMEADSVAKVWI